MKKNKIFIGRQVWPAALAVIIVSALVSISGCSVSKRKPEGPLEKLSPSDYPVFGDDMLNDGLEHAISKSLEYLGRVSPDKTFQFGTDTYDARHMIRSLERFRWFIRNSPSETELEKFIKTHYHVYKSIGGENDGKMFFTGYYEPLLEGSLKKTHTYKYPVYARPEDLAVVDLSAFSKKFEGEKIIGRVNGKTFVPYHERSEIENGALTGKAEPLAWVGDRVGLFFLQVQGSGRITLPDGKTVNVHYNAKNGRPYRSIGKLLIDKGKVDRSEMSMQKIREYIRANPHEADDIMNYNPSYVFFSVEKDGPYGALNVTLTPGRSIAVDRKVFPMSALAFVKTQKPTIDEDGRIAEWVDFSRFTLCQDTGGAIKGPGRADLFWGNGHYAEIAAGHMRHDGDLYVLVLKP